VVVCGFCAGVLLGALFWFCLFVGVSGVEMCVSACFFSSASASAEKLHDVL